MTEEQIQEKKKYAGEKRPSMKRRDEGHDYKERRMYMITIEVEGRRPIFGQLAGDVFAKAGSGNEPRIVLTKLGEAVRNEWLGITRYFPQIEVRAVQMMPDHMHGILFVRSTLPVHLGQVISGFKAGCRKALRAMASQSVAAEPSLTAKGLFAQGYNDLILRSYEELSVWTNYLQDNPRRLMMKRALPELLRPFFGLNVGSHTYSGIGNRQLLTAERRLSVRLSRRLTEQETEREMQRLLEAAREGAVLVSPAISPAEKRVMRAAFDAGYSTVVIMENGFTPLSKPHGEQFYACAAGRLLMLSPWEHHNEKRKITATQCQQLNLMALEICT